MFGGLVGGCFSCQSLSAVIPAPITPQIERPRLSEARPYQVRIRTHSGWRLSANQAGLPAARAEDIASFRLYLIDTLAPVGDLTPSWGPFDVSAQLENGEQTVVFSQVTASLQQFYVAVQALDSQGNNLTQLDSGWRIAGESVILSQAGGNGAGQIMVSAASGYAVSSSVPLDVNLALRSALGAQVETSLSVNAGNLFQLENVAYFELYLLDNNTGNPTILAGPLLLNQNLNNGQQVFQLSQLPPGSFYVALAAYDAQGNNLTVADVSLGGESVAVSSSGGESSFQGRISVGLDYTISTDNPLSLSLNLL